MAVQRSTVDLSRFPDLVVIYLGMKVRTLRGLKTVFSFGPKIGAAASAKPDGLLLHESIFYSVYPLHVGMRQYWRDFTSLESWSRSLPHQDWWKDFLKDSGGVGFWHESSGHSATQQSLPKNRPGDPGSMHASVSAWRVSPRFLPPFLKMLAEASYS